jgi:G:T/U-mismatch repair DNA glycosylase
MPRKNRKVSKYFSGGDVLKKASAIPCDALKSGPSPKRRKIGDRRYAVSSFEPILGSTKPHTLLLGTMPSIKSHAKNQYYAHQANAFWWIVGDAFNFRRGGAETEMKWPHQFGFKKDGSPMVVPKPILDALKATKRFDGDGAGPILPYKKQVERLTDNGFVLWDVIRDCTITNSDDTSIKDEMPNKIFELLHQYPTIDRIVFASGQKSAQKFKKLNKSKLLGRSWSFAGNDVSKKVFGRKIIISTVKNVHPPGDKRRRMNLIIPISVSPAVTKKYTIKSNNWMKLVFEKFSKPLYPEE